MHEPDDIIAVSVELAAMVTPAAETTSLETWTSTGPAGAVRGLEHAWRDPDTGKRLIHPRVSNAGHPSPLAIAVDPLDLDDNARDRAATMRAVEFNARAIALVALDWDWKS